MPFKRKSDRYLALTKKGSSFLVMAIAGGAFCPPIMGDIADHFNMAIGFIIPMACFAFISYFGIIGYRKFLKQVS